MLQIGIAEINKRPSVIDTLNDVAQIVSDTPPPKGGGFLFQSEHI